MEKYSAVPGATEHNAERPPAEESPQVVRTVDRSLVHRASLSEVFLTDIRRSGDATFRVGAQWPRRHIFYRGTEGLPDSALMAETLRQAVILVAHYCGVPLEHKFLMPGMSIQTAPHRLDPLRPADLTVDLTVNSSGYRSGFLATLDISAVFGLGTATLGQGRATARILDAATYARYRRPASLHPPLTRFPHRLDAASVGHRDDRNVVLGVSDRPLIWPLLVDTSHPVLFDHPLDHVPGMLLLEATRQAARVATGNPALDFAHFAADFTGVVEHWHDAEVSVRLEPGTGAVAVVSHGTEALTTVRAAWS